MQRFFHSLYLVAITLWVGGQWTIGYVVAPTLFKKLTDRALAGQLAGTLFALMAWIGIACAVVILGYLLSQRGLRALKSSAWWIALLMLLLTLASHFGIAPIMAQLKLEALPREVMDSLLRDRFATWHGVSSVIYLVQSLLGLFLVFRHNR